MSRQSENPADTPTRRRFLTASALSAGGLLTGCVTNPVTGRSQLMLMSQVQEINADKSSSPHQFSADYGVVQDAKLNAYIQSVGQGMVRQTHRPDMPYSFRAVNATYINAYAFPGGSIATTRGILLELENEAELAALLGHELGHVNARHTAQQMTKGMLTGLVLAGVTTYAKNKSDQYGQLAQSLGQIGAGMMLAHYSRDNEHEADSLGMQYLVNSDYTPEGMVGLMGVLKGLSSTKPSAIELMFSTHPWSGDRYDRAVQSARSQYAANTNQRINRERYMDNTAQLRKLKGAIDAMQKGERAMMSKRMPEAESELKNALKQAPKDYTGHVLMAKYYLTNDNPRQALAYAREAQALYPKEAQAHHISGVTKLRLKDYAGSHRDFEACDRNLPGNPTITFFKGRALEGMSRRDAAAAEYKQYLSKVNEGEYAQYAYQRLVEWGHIKPAAQPAQ